MKEESFLVSTFSEPDGKGSFTRLATALLILAAIAWVTRLVWINHALPDFSGLIVFISALYGLNKASSLVDKIAGKPDQPKTEAPAQ
jgi:hypothetical protein